MKSEKNEKMTNANEFKKKFKVVCRKCNTGKFIKIVDAESVSYREESHNYDYISCKCENCGEEVSLF